MRGLHAGWMRDGAYRAACEALEPAFVLATVMIGAPACAGLTREQVAGRMATTPSVVARLESGRVRPSTRTLERYARATGTRPRISFEPVGS